MNWYLFIGLALVAWLWQNITHELSHLWSGWLWEGRRPKKLIFWPHVFEGRFYWSRYESDVPMKNGSPRHRHSAPLRWASVQFAVATAIYCMMAYRGLEGVAYMAPFTLAPLVDALVWMWGYLTERKDTDGARWKSQRYFESIKFPNS